jgi:hypothetical protein
MFSRKVVYIEENVGLIIAPGRHLVAWLSFWSREIFSNLIMNDI